MDVIKVQYKDTTFRQYNIINKNLLIINEILLYNNLVKILLSQHQFGLRPHSPSPNNPTL